VENWATTNKQTWLIGEDLGTPLRSMSNPGLYRQPDTYGAGPNWWSPSNLTWDNGGVHRNSGVMNYWFYLLSVGGSGTNDIGIGNAYNITGIGIDKASRIVYDAERYYLNSSADYNAARNATISSAKLNYGINSNEYISVINAWYAVGVGDMFQPYISGSSIVCPYSNVTLSLVGRMFNTPITWTSDNYTLVSASGNDATFRNTATTPQGGTIWASYSGIRLGKTVFVLFNPNQLGQYSANAITNTNYTITPPQTPDVMGYSWVVQQAANGAVLSNMGLTCDVRFTQPGTYVICAYGKYSCATSTTPTYMFFYMVSLPAGGYSSPVATYAVTAYPNPASSIVNIEIKGSEIATSDSTQANIASSTQNKTGDFRIRLYDEHGNLMHHTTTKKGDRAHFSVAHLINGIYYLNVYDETTGKTEKQLIIVSH